MKWLEDLFYLVAFAVTVALVTFSVYDGNAYPTVAPASVVAGDQRRDREMPSPEDDPIPTVAVVLAEEAP